MAGNHAFSVSKNFAYVGGDTVEELHQRLIEFNSAEGIDQQIALFSEITAGNATTAAIAAVQHAMPGTTVVTPPAAAAPAPVAVPAAAPVAVPAPAAAPSGPPAPAPPAAGNTSVVKHWQFNNRYYVLNHPDAALTPTGQLAALQYWKTRGGKHLKKWVDPLFADQQQWKSASWEGGWADGADVSMCPPLTEPDN